MTDIPVTGGGSLHVPSRMLGVEYRMLEDGTEIVRLEITRGPQSGPSDEEVRDALRLAGKHLGVTL